jgi:hypothetical protein
LKERILDKDKELFLSVSKKQKPISEPAELLTALLSISV